MKSAITSRSTVGVRELRDRLSAHLDRVKHGEEITVTEHGRPIAVLHAVSPEVDRMAELIEAGIVRPPVDPERRLPAQRVRVAGSGSLDDEVAAQRR
jgi:prevent-host-death family protein